VVTWDKGLLVDCACTTPSTANFANTKSIQWHGVHFMPESEKTECGPTPPPKGSQGAFKACDALNPGLLGVRLTLHEQNL